MKFQRLFDLGLMLATSASSLPLCLAQQAVAAEVQARQYDIPAQPLAIALLEYSRQSDRRVQAPMEWLEGKNAPALRGTFTPDEALDRLLAGTGIAAAADDKGNVTLRRIGVGEPGAGQGPAASASAEWEPEEIVVTGSHIRGAGTPVGSQLITVDREQIEQAGYSNIRDFAQFLPQNFGGGASGERQISAAGNTNAATTFNLRGLGPTATLTLVNGRRLPLTGIQAVIADISAIPLAAIQRIEVLPDGASAVYGSDAIAGVVNIILRKDFEGQETSARLGTATQGEMNEYQFSHTSGTAWATGHAILSYEFYRRGMLKNKDRWFASTMDLRQYGGQDFRPLYGAPGNILDPEQSIILFALPKGQDGTGLTREDLLPPEMAEQYDYVKDFTMIPRQTRHSVFGYFSQNLTSDLEFFLEARYGHRKHVATARDPLQNLTVPVNNPYWFDAYGTGAPVRVAYSFDPIAESRVWGSTESYNVVSGFKAEHPSQWVTRAYLSYSADRSNLLLGSIDSVLLNEAIRSSDPNSAFNPFGDGTVIKMAVPDSIMYVIRSYERAKSIQASLISDGPLFEKFGNTIRGAVGVDYRKESFDSNDGITPSPTSRSLKREVAAVFGELRVPIMTYQNRVDGIEQLEISASLRHEKYQDSTFIPVKRDAPTQSTTNPRVGVMWSPFSGLRVNGSYGTSFRAPNLSTIAALPTVNATFIADPFTSGSTRRYILQLAGAHNDLKPERAKTWTIGVDAEPRLIDGLSLNIFYFNVEYRDQVLRPDSSLFMINPAFDDFVVANPTPEHLAYACGLAAPGRLNVATGDCEAGSPVTAIYDVRTSNIARTHMDGFDINVSYKFNIAGLGDFNAYANATYIRNFKQAQTARLGLDERVDTGGFPADLRTRASFTWRPDKAFHLSAYMNYVDSYKDEVNSKKVSSWTTFDISAAYHTGKRMHSSFLNNLTLQLTALNVFDRNPPFYISPSGLTGSYDPDNAEPTGRFISFSIKKRW